MPGEPILFRPSFRRQDCRAGFIGQVAVLILSPSSELARRGAGGVTGRAREYEDGRLLGSKNADTRVSRNHGLRGWS